MPWRAERGRIDEVAVWADTNGRFGLCFDYDEGAVDQVKALPPHLRKWDPHLKVWWIFTQAQAYRLAEIAAAYLDLEVEHYLSRPDWLKDRAAWIQGRGWERDRFHRPPGEEEPKKKSSKATAWTVLHLRDDAPAELVKAAYRVLARIHHPDAGGDPEQMKRINNAYEELTK